MLGRAIQPEIRGLIEAGRFDELRDDLSGLEVADIADILEDLPAEDQAVVFRLLPRELATDVFENLRLEDEEQLLKNLSQEKVGEILNAMSPDDRTHLFEELPAAVTRRLLKSLSPDELKVARTLLGYPEDSIGRLMTPDYFAARPAWTVQDTIDKIREDFVDVETINYIYLLDEKGRLLDDIYVGRLITARPGTPMAELADESFISLSPFDDREQAVVEFKKYDRSALPVIDRTGNMLGIVTFDDVLDVEEEEATEDVQLFGGQAALDESYFHASPWVLFRKRAGWLTVLFVGGYLTSLIMRLYVDVLGEAVTISAYIPLILATGGNAGSQSAAMIIRGLATREIQLSDCLRVLGRELGVGWALGCFLGIVLGGVQILRLLTGIGEDSIPFAIVAFVSVLSVVTLGTMLGAFLPFFFKRLGIDPAVSSAPFIATFVDLSGIVIYLSLVTALLSG